MFLSSNSIPIFYFPPNSVVLYIYFPFLLTSLATFHNPISSVFQLGPPQHTFTPTGSSSNTTRRHTRTLFVDIFYLSVCKVHRKVKNVTVKTVSTLVKSQGISHACRYEAIRFLSFSSSSSSSSSNVCFLSQRGMTKGWNGSIVIFSLRYHSHYFQNCKTTYNL